MIFFGSQCSNTYCVNAFPKDPVPPVTRIVFRLTFSPPKSHQSA